MAPEVVVSSENALFAECLAERIRRESGAQARVTGTVPEQMLRDLKRSASGILLLDSDSWNAVSERLLLRLRAKFPALRVLVLIARPDDALSVRLLGYGAAGVQSRTLDFATLLRAIETVASGKSWADRRVLTQAISRAQRRLRGGARPLTPRERQILTLLGDGYRNKEIAARLDIKEQTVKVHLYSLFKKLNVRTRVEAALKAAEGGRASRR
ncbi:MAG: response regulator transcription factor [Acidobacteriota bacterium]